MVIHTYDCSPSVIDVDLLVNVLWKKQKIISYAFHIIIDISKINIILDIPLWLIFHYAYKERKEMQTLYSLQMYLIKYLYDLSNNSERKDHLNKSKYFTQIFS